MILVAYMILLLLLVFRKGNGKNLGEETRLKSLSHFDCRKTWCFIHYPFLPQGWQKHGGVEMSRRRAEKMLRELSTCHHVQDYDAVGLFPKRTKTLAYTQDAVMDDHDGRKSSAPLSSSG